MVAPLATISHRCSYPIPQAMKLDNDHNGIGSDCQAASQYVPDELGGKDSCRQINEEMSANGPNQLRMQKLSTRQRCSLCASEKSTEKWESFPLSGAMKLGYFQFTLPA